MAAREELIKGLIDELAMARARGEPRIKWSSAALNNDFDICPEGNWSDFGREADDMHYIHSKLQEIAAGVARCELWRSGTKNGGQELQGRYRMQCEFPPIEEEKDC